jgi:HSP20 family protein
MLTRYYRSNPLFFRWEEPFTARRALSGELHAGLHTSMNRLFDDLLRDFDVALRPSSRQNPAHLEESPAAYTFAADLPGVRREDVEITVDQGVLGIRATRQGAAPEGAEAVVRERSSGSVAWTFPLPARVDAQNATASLKNGRLEVTVPKTP